MSTGKTLELSSISKRPPGTQNTSKLHSDVEA